MAYAYKTRGDRNGNISVTGLGSIDFESDIIMWRGSYETSDIDWEEFWNVIKGNGPCNTQRIKHHAAAHDNGQWVREAAIAYNEKKEQKLKSA